MNSAKVQFNEVDQSFFVNSLLQGVVAVLLQTPRGPYGVNDELMVNPQQFQKIYGVPSAGFPGMLLAVRALARGAKLRVVKIGHYSSLADKTTLTATKAVFNDPDAHYGKVGSDDVDAFTITLKNAGADGNYLELVIAAASNGDADYFNLEINHTQEPGLSEVYSNLIIPGAPTAAESHYLDDVISKSKFVNVAYHDISAEIDDVPLRPTNGTTLAAGGANGAPVSADYAGNSGGGTGIYFLDQYDDFNAFTSLDDESTTWANAAVAYSKNREDCVAIIHVPNSNDTVSEVQTFRTGLTADTRYAYFVCGGLRVQNPYSQAEVGAPYDISEAGDVMGIIGASAAKFGPWYSFAGLNRGQVDNVLGVVNNFLPGGAARLDQLAQKQINAMVTQSGVTFLKGNFSAQKATSRKSFMNVVMLLIFIRKALKPTLEKYLEEPNDFKTFKDIFNEVQPFFESLKSKSSRALVDYEWKGDQFANTDADLKVNNRADLDQGKYKVELWLKEVVSLQEMTITIISAPSGVSFEDNLN